MMRRRMMLRTSDHTLWRRWVLCRICGAIRPLHQPCHHWIVARQWGFGGLIGVLGWIGVLGYVAWAALLVWLWFR
jgi:hypothetical protein